MNRNSFTLYCILQSTLISPFIIAINRLSSSIPPYYMNMRLSDSEIDNYINQSQWHYCAPASALMVLKYIDYTPIPSQDELANEMNCTMENKGIARAIDLLIPFELRKNPSYTFGGTTLKFVDALDELRINLKEDYAVILNIWFDSTRQNGHFIVAYGYNETGVFVHNPWGWTNCPPKNRGYGSFLFLSNTQLEYLWSYYDYWALVLRVKPTFSLTISIIDIFGGLQNADVEILWDNNTVLETVRTGMDGLVSRYLAMEKYGIEVEFYGEKRFLEVKLNSNKTLEIHMVFREMLFGIMIIAFLAIYYLIRKRTRHGLMWRIGERSKVERKKKEMHACRRPA